MRYLFEFNDLIGPMARIVGPPRGYSLTEAIAEIDAVLEELADCRGLLLVRRRHLLKALLRARVTSERLPDWGGL